MMKKTASLICPLAVQMLRIQRHDFFNHIQVVNAYLELGKSDKAAEYLGKVVEEIAAIDYSKLTWPADETCAQCTCGEKSD